MARPEKAMLLIGNPLPAGATTPPAESSPHARWTVTDLDEAVGDLHRRPPSRLTRVGKVFVSIARCGGALLFGRLRRRQDPAAAGRYLQARLRELGGAWILLGRALAIRYDLFPAAFCDELKSIADASSPLDSRMVVSAVERELGRPIGETFSFFDHLPASTTWRAQEHRAVLLDGESVTVTVRRPGLVSDIEADLACVRVVLWLVDFLIVPGHIRLGASYPEFRRRVLDAASLTTDGRNADRLAAQCDTNPREYVPHVYWSLTTSDLLTVERLDGPSVADVMRAVRDGTSPAAGASSSDAQAIDPAALARTLLVNCLGQTFDGRYFLRELKPEQLVVLPGDGIGYRELGTLERIDSRVRRHQMGLVSALRSADVDALFDIVLELIEPPCDADLIALEERVKSRLWRRLDGSDDPDGPQTDGRVSRLLHEIFDDVRRLRIPVSDAALAMAGTLADVEEIVYSLVPGFEMRNELTAFFRTALVSRIRRQLNLQALSDVVLDYEHLLLALPGYMRQSMHVAQQSRSPLVRRVDTWRVGWWKTFQRLATAAIGGVVLAWIAVAMAPDRLPHAFTPYVSPAGWIGGLAALIVLRRVAALRYDRHAAGEARAEGCGMSGAVVARQVLKRAKSAPDAGVDPLGIVHVGLGCLGAFYESQLVYVKHQLEKSESSEGADPLVAALEGAHALAVEVVSRLMTGEPIDPALFPDLLAANGRTIDGLAAEGRDLLARLGPGKAAM
jgi:ubiquinone biosynthesis protein